MGSRKALGQHSITDRPVTRQASVGEAGIKTAFRFWGLMESIPMCNYFTKLRKPSCDLLVPPTAFSLWMIRPKQL